MSALSSAIDRPGAGAAPPAPAPASSGIDPAFLSSLAHELRNPLAPLVNALFLLRTKIAGDKDATWALDIVDRQVGDLRALLDDTSDIARLLRGRLAAPTGQVAAADVAQGAANAARPLLAARRQTVEVQLTEAAPVVHGDRARLVRAVTALIVQAGRGAAQGDAVGVAIDDANPRYVTFVVEGPVGAAAASSAAPASFDAGIGVALADAVAQWHGGSLVQRTEGARPRYELQVPRALE